MDAVKQLMNEAAEATLRGDADAVEKTKAALEELTRARNRRPCRPGGRHSGAGDPWAGNLRTPNPEG